MEKEKKKAALPNKGDDSTDLTSEINLDEEGIIRQRNKRHGAYQVDGIGRESSDSFTDEFVEGPDVVADNMVFGSQVTVHGTVNTTQHCISVTEAPVLIEGELLQNPSVLRGGEDDSVPKVKKTSMWDLSLRKNIRKIFFILGGGVFCSVVVVVLLLTRDARETASKTSQQDLSDRVSAIQQALLSSIPLESTQEALQQEHSFQHKALVWLVEEDERQLSPNDFPALVQRFALACLYFSTGGGSTDGNNSTWLDNFGFFSSEHECRWNVDAIRVTHDSPIPEKKGVSCTNETSGIIDKVVMYQNNMTGSIPEEIGLLTGLRWIEFWDNNLSGSIPESLGLLTNLENLDLGFNSLSGTLPSAFGKLKNLEQFWCDYCGRALSGTIPSEMSHLEKLRAMSVIWTMSLTGTIPDWIGNLSNLEHLELAGNNFSGTIPHSLFRMKSLVMMNFARQVNGLTGTLPLDGLNLPSLRFMHLWGNKLSGTISTSIGNLPSIEVYNNYDNMFVGSLPDTMAQSSNLKIIQFGLNQLTGTIPSSFSQLSKLSWILLNGNHLEGTIPPSLFENKQDLGVVDLKNNNLNGTIPSTLSNLEKLWSVALNSNKLTGSVPIDISTSTNLRQLQFANNNLFGSIPTSSFKNLTKLEFLSLSRNNFVGSLNLFCSNNSSTFLAADCAAPEPEVECDCCQHCCNDRDKECDVDTIAGLNKMCSVQISRDIKIRPRDIHRVYCDNESLLKFLP